MKNIYISIWDDAEQEQNDGNEEKREYKQLINKKNTDNKRARKKIPFAKVFLVKLFLFATSQNAIRHANEFATEMHSSKWNRFEQRKRERGILRGFSVKSKHISNSDDKLNLINMSKNALWCCVFGCCCRSSFECNEWIHWLQPPSPIREKVQRMIALVVPATHSFTTETDIKVVGKNKQTNRWCNYYLSIADLPNNSKWTEEKNEQKCNQYLKSFPISNWQPAGSVLPLVLEQRQLEEWREKKVCIRTRWNNTEREGKN